jgi:hypothetical protein
LQAPRKSPFLIYLKTVGKGLVKVEPGNKAHWNEDAAVYLGDLGWTCDSSQYQIERKAKTPSRSSYHNCQDSSTTHRTTSTGPAATRPVSSHPLRATRWNGFN